MNGMEPPTPMSTGSVPSHASVNAARAASYAGPVASIARIGSPLFGERAGHLGLPHGTCWARRCSAKSARWALAVLSPGAIRSERNARACGTSVLLAPCAAGASMPVTLSEGLVQSRSTIGPFADPADALGGCPDFSRALGAPDTRRSAAAAADPVRSTATLPASSCSVASSRAQRHQGVGHDAAPHAGVDTVVERAAPRRTSAPGRAGLVVERGLRRCPSCRSRRSRSRPPRASSPAWLNSAGSAVGADLLLTLHDDLDPSPAGPSPKTRSAPRCAATPGLVVGRAASVQAFASFGRLEGRAVPSRAWSFSGCTSWCA